VTGLPTVWDDKEDSVHIVCFCREPARKRYRVWGSMFLTAEDVEKVMVDSILSLVTNRGLSLVL
jgi:hypothetical protein